MNPSTPAIQVLCAVLFFALPAGAQETTPDEAHEVHADEIVVTATRRPEAIATLPQAITVITRQELEEKARVSNRNLGELLGKAVPGLALGSQSASTFGQTLRGRNVLVMIDGVPQSAIRNAMHDLQAMDLAAVDRVEVIRGTTAIYGEGASGGIINIITRPHGSGPLKLQTTLEASTAPAQPANGLSGVLTQTASAQHGAFAWTFAGSYQRSGGYFDAEGDLIPPDPHGQGGLANTDGFTLFGKAQYRIDDKQRLRLMADHTNGTQRTDLASDPSVNTLPARTQKSRAIPGLQLDHPQTTRNTVLNLIYDHDEVWGSTLRAQAYVRDHFTRFFPFDARRFPANYGDNIVQSRLETTKGGGRLEVGTPLPLDLNALWGVDGSHESTQQPVTLFDHASFDQSGGLSFRAIGERGWVPRMNVTALAAFLQLEWQALPNLTLRAGTRYEHSLLAVPDYVTLADAQVRGGQLSFGRPLFNAGAVYSPVQPIDVYLNLAQGFSLPDVGLILRNARPSAPGETVSVASLQTEPQVVDLVEAGARARWEKVQASLAAFYNRSDLGTSSGGLNQPVVRAPERVYGVEATAAVEPIERLTVGSSFTWVEGQLDKKGDGNFTFLNSYRIPPPKLTAQVQHETLGGWRNGVQFTYSGWRRRFGDSTAYGERAVDPYFTVDLTTSFKAGPGVVSAAVSNLLNHQYYVRESQLFGQNSSYSASRGRVVTVGYSVTY